MMDILHRLNWFGTWRRKPTIYTFNEEPEESSLNHSHGENGGIALAAKAYLEHFFQAKVERENEAIIFVEEVRVLAIAVALSKKRAGSQLTAPSILIAPKAVINLLLALERMDDVIEWKPKDNWRTKKGKIVCVPGMLYTEKA